jgi:hypothetical protein
MKRRPWLTRQSSRAGTLFTGAATRAAAAAAAPEEAEEAEEAEEEEEEEKEAAAAATAAAEGPLQRRRDGSTVGGCTA